jgi:hypothetical protein
MTEQTELLREMVDLLRVIAEPALAKRDERYRGELKKIVGKSKQKAAAVLLMDGSRTQAVITSETGIDKGALSRCVKELAAANLIAKDEKHPKLAISIPPNLFD